MTSQLNELLMSIIKANDEGLVESLSLVINNHCVYHVACADIDKKQHLQVVAEDLAELTIQIKSAIDNLEPTKIH